MQWTRGITWLYVTLTVLMFMLPEVSRVRKLVAGIDIARLSGAEPPQTNGYRSCSVDALRATT